MQPAQLHVFDWIHCNIDCPPRPLRFQSVAVALWATRRGVHSPGLTCATLRTAKRLQKAHSLVYVIGIFFRRDCAPGRFGRVSRNTPFLNSAFALDSSTSAGNSIAR